MVELFLPITTITTIQEASVLVFLCAVKAS